MRSAGAGFAGWDRGSKGDPADRLGLRALPDETGRKKSIDTPDGKHLTWRTGRSDALRLLSQSRLKVWNGGKTKRW